VEAHTEKWATLALVINWLAVVKSGSFIKLRTLWYGRGKTQPSEERRQQDW
jgi:hypothetical protein